LLIWVAVVSFVMLLALGPCPGLLSGLSLKQYNSSTGAK
jgi:hypothetical protein